MVGLLLFDLVSQELLSLGCWLQALTTAASNDHILNPESLDYLLHNI
ncbi:hypothetical protein ACF7Y4_11140 [Vibrio diabolicus]